MSFEHRISRPPRVSVAAGRSRICGRLHRRASITSRVAGASTSLLIFLTFEASATSVWTWIDEKGFKHYSQTPVPGATRVEIDPSNRVRASVPQAATRPSADSVQGTKSAANVNYSEFSIVQPADGETLHNVGGVVPVTLQINPTLQPGHGVDSYLDDRRLDGISPTATSFELKDVPRGTHLLFAVIQDERRKPLQEAAVTFYVRQTSIIRPGPPKPVQPLPKRP